MPSTKQLSATLLIFSILFYSSTFSIACCSCKNPNPPAPAPMAETCPKDTLKLGACVDLLGLINLQNGSPPTSGCCALLEGLTDLEAAICLCTVIKANAAGLVNLEVPVALSLLVSACQKTVPPGFKCE
ncbi:lipid-binding protein AIR1 [Pyrus ussuriensis x Pyrus communis]|uniref:Lipid-binding protein AIR1 n=1 Tax=Pyrus ussuriensis x Pyrus communis TaxID=2448454 RepID=A0A5N5GTZ3_9ROSA|nr:lipid-binding protein AIR1 [Pyrus ussuriensis x Pyrus communis]